MAISAGQPAFIRDWQKDFVEDIVAGNSSGSMPSFTEVGEPMLSVSFWWGADMLTHILAFPLGFSFTRIGFDEKSDQGNSCFCKGPKHRPSAIHPCRESATLWPNSEALGEFGQSVGSRPFPLHPMLAPSLRRSSTRCSWRSSGGIPTSSANCLSFTGQIQLFTGTISV